MDVTPTFTTERLTLRGWQERDFAPVAAFFANDPDAVFVGGPKRGRDMSVWFMARIGQWAWRGYGVFALALRDSGALVGWCGANHYPDRDEPGVQYALFEPFRGQRLMAEGGAPALAHVFKASGRASLTTTIHPDNVASQRVARHIGGAPDGTSVIDDGHAVAVWQFKPLRAS